MTSLTSVAKIGLATLCMATLTQCSEHSQDDRGIAQAPTQKSKNPLTVQSPPLVKPSSLIVTLWQSQQGKLDQAINAAERLQTSVQTLLSEPTAESLSATQNEWLEAVDAVEALTLIGRLAKSAQGSAWQSVNHAFEQIARWPAELGYLDDNGIHGKTGLIFDLDTVINIDTLRHQHGLTDPQDATLGLYPLGLMLWGANGGREARDFALTTTLNENHRVMGYTDPNELPNNRRRQLVALQAQMLAADLSELKDIWARRDRNSAVNALSQLTLDEQRKVGISAGLSLTAQQMVELKNNTGQSAANSEEYALWTTLRRNQRWLSQLASLEQWLTLMDLSSALAPVEQLKITLAESNARVSTKPSGYATPDMDQSGAANSPAAPEAAAQSETTSAKLANTDSSTDPIPPARAHDVSLETDEQIIESQLSTVVLRLKQSLAQISIES